MKRFYLTTIIVCLLTLLGASFVYRFWDKKPENMKLVVGYLSENDEMTASTYNFFQSQNILEKEFPEQVEILTKTNVQEDETMDALDDLIHSGARILFTNTRSEKVQAAAGPVDPLLCAIMMQPSSIRSFALAFSRLKLLSAFA